MFRKSWRPYGMLHLCGCVVFIHLEAAWHWRLWECCTSGVLLLNPSPLHPPSSQTCAQSQTYMHVQDHYGTQTWHTYGSLMCRRSLKKNKRTRQTQCQMRSHGHKPRDCDTQLHWQLNGGQDTGHTGVTSSSVQFNFTTPSTHFSSMQSGWNWVRRGRD